MTSIYFIRHVREYDVHSIGHRISTSNFTVALQFYEIRPPGSSSAVTIYKEHDDSYLTNVSYCGSDINSR